MKCPKYEMICPSDPCVLVCEATKPKPPLRYPNLEVPATPPLSRPHHQEGGK